MRRAEPGDEVIAAAPSRRDKRLSPDERAVLAVLVETGATSDAAALDTATIAARCFRVTGRRVPYGRAAEAVSNLSSPDHPAGQLLDATWDGKHYARDLGTIENNHRPSKAAMSTTAPPSAPKAAQSKTITLPPMGSTIDRQKLAQMLGVDHSAVKYHESMGNLPPSVRGTGSGRPSLYPVDAKLVTWVESRGFDVEHAESRLPTTSREEWPDFDPEGQPPPSTNGHAPAADVPDRNNEPAPAEALDPILLDAGDVLDAEAPAISADLAEDLDDREQEVRGMVEEAENLLRVASTLFHSLNRTRQRVGLPSIDLNIPA